MGGGARGGVTSPFQENLKLKRVRIEKNNVPGWAKGGYTNTRPAEQLTEAKLTSSAATQGRAAQGRENQTRVPTAKGPHRRILGKWPSAPYNTGRSKNGAPAPQRHHRRNEASPEDRNDRAGGREIATITQHCDPDGDAAEGPGLLRTATSADPQLCPGNTSAAPDDRWVRISTQQPAVRRRSAPPHRHLPRSPSLAPRSRAPRARNVPIAGGRVPQTLTLRTYNG